jgi:hypothetical protein
MFSAGFLLACPGSHQVGVHINVVAPGEAYSTDSQGVTVDDNNLPAQYWVDGKMEIAPQSQGRPSML